MNDSIFYKQWYKMNKILKKGLIISGAIIGFIILYYIFIIGLFAGLYDAHSKERIFEQQTSIGLFSITQDTGDPLSSDSWEFKLDDILIKKVYVDYSSHIDTLVIDDLYLYLIVENKAVTVRFDVKEENKNQRIF